MSLYGGCPAPNSGDAAPSRPEDPAPAKPTVPAATQLLPASLVSRRPGVQKASNNPIALAAASAPVPTAFAPISDSGQVACGLLQSITDLCTFATTRVARARVRDAKGVIDHHSSIHFQTIQRSPTTTWSYAKSA